MNFHILTLFPEMVEEGLNTSILKRASESGCISINAINIRDYSTDKHKKVDDYPYGGGAGMLMQAQPVFDAYEDLCGAIKKSRKSRAKKLNVRVLYMTPQGKRFDQKMAEELSKEKDLIFLCGHYSLINAFVMTA